MPDLSNIENSVNLIIWLSIGVPLLIVALVVWRVIVPMVKSTGQTNKLLKNGVPAQALIMRTWDTGVAINDNPQVGFALEVRPSGMPPFMAEAVALVSIIHLAQYQPGGLVEVRYDPTNTRKVAIAGPVSMPMYNNVQVGGGWGQR